MRFISTKSDKVPASLSDAVNHCVASDGGLYMPESIPVIPKALFNNIGEMSLREVAYVVSSAFFGDDVPCHELKKIVDESFMYDVPMLKVATTAMCSSSFMVLRLHSRISGRVSWLAS